MFAVFGEAHNPFGYNSNLFRNKPQMKGGQHSQPALNYFETGNDMTMKNCKLQLKIN